MINEDKDSNLNIVDDLKKNYLEEVILSNELFIVEPQSSKLILKENNDQDISNIEIYSHTAEDIFLFKKKIIQTNITTNTIELTENFTLNFYDNKKLDLEKSENNTIHNKTLKDLDSTYYSMEILQNKINKLSLEKDKLEIALLDCFDNKHIVKDAFLNDKDLLENINKLLNYLKYDKLITNNLTIMKDKNLLAKFKENKILINLPIMFSHISNEGTFLKMSSIYSNLFNKLFKKIEDLKKEIELIPKSTTTNITINNTLQGNNNTNTTKNNTINGKSLVQERTQYLLEKLNENEDYYILPNSNNMNLMNSLNGSLNSSNCNCKFKQKLEKLEEVSVNHSLISENSNKFSKNGESVIANKIFGSFNSPLITHQKNIKNNTNSYFILKKNGKNLSNKSIYISNLKEQDEKMTFLQLQINNFKEEEEKKRKDLESSLINKFNKEINELNLKLTEKEFLLENSKSDKKNDSLYKNEKTICIDISYYKNICDLTNKLNAELVDYKYLVDKRQISSLLLNINTKKINFNLKQELIKQLGEILDLSFEEMKIIGLKDSEKINESNIYSNNLLPPKSEERNKILFSRESKVIKLSSNNSKTPKVNKSRMINDSLPKVCEIVNNLIMIFDLLEKGIESK